MEPGPWAGAWRGYAGWVPNVRSHLSFSMIGAARGAVTFTRPRRRQPVRLVVVHQRRVVNDLPLPRWLATLVRPGIAVHWVLEAETEATVLPAAGPSGLVPERDRQGMLRGRILFLPRAETAAARSARSAALANLDEEVRRWRRQADGALDGARAEARLRAETSGVHLALEFALLRNGECRIWYPSPAPGMSRARMDRVAEHAYYFVKDLVHDHTHHDASSDQITPLVRLRTGSGEPGHDHEVAWRRETLWSLSREVERLNRDGGLTNQRRSLGVIAYAEAFQSALMGWIRDPGDPRGFRDGIRVHDFDFKHLKDSVKADIDVNATRQSQSVQVTIAAAATFVSTTSLASSLIGTHNGAIRADGAAGTVAGIGSLEGLLPYLSWNPALAGLVVTVLLLSAVSYFLLDGRAGVYTRTQRVLSQFGRALATGRSASPSVQLRLDLAWHLGLAVSVFWLIVLLLRYMLSLS